MNVGVSIKNVGNYLKTTISKTSAETLKSMNQAYKPTSPSPSKSNSNADVLNKMRQSTNLTHRHSNPAASYSTPANLPATGVSASSNKTRTLQKSTTIQDSPAKALPRIRINS